MESSQSSSTPLQISPGGAQFVPEGIWHALVQVPVPHVPHGVMQETDDPMTHGNPLSGTVSQSSSELLQISAGGVQSAAEGYWHASVQSPDPAVPHEDVQLTADPRAHGKLSSGTVSQSSSTPLQRSSGGVQFAGAGNSHKPVH